MPLLSSSAGSSPSQRRVHVKLDPPDWKQNNKATSGYVVSANSTATTVAVGNPKSSPPRVEVYTKSYGGWSKKGQTITGSVGEFGSAVALTRRSLTERLVIGSPNENKAYLYQFNTATQAWFLEYTFTMPGQTDFGFSVAISDFGNRVAIGSPSDGTNGTKAGAVTCYDRDETWYSIGSLFGTGENGQAGYSVSLEELGDRLAFCQYGGSPSPNLVSVYDIFVFNNTGFFSESTFISQEIGFGSALTLSPGGRALVIGSPRYSSNNLIDRGRVAIYSGISKLSKIGEILGEASNERLGTSVAYDQATGTYVCGSPFLTKEYFFSGTSQFIQSGGFRAFRSVGGVLQQIGSTVYGEALNLSTPDSLGSTIAISNDGKRIIAGSSIPSTEYFSEYEFK